MPKSATFHFDEDDACKHGLQEAIILDKFVVWITKAKASEHGEHEGRTWISGGAEALKRLFPFWSARQIDTILKSLCEQKIIVANVIVGDGFNPTPYLRTRWYAFTDEAIWLPKRLVDRDDSHLTNSSHPFTDSSNGSALSVNGDDGTVNGSTSLKEVEPSLKKEGTPLPPNNPEHPPLVADSQPVQPQHQNNIHSTVGGEPIPPQQPAVSVSPTPADVAPSDRASKAQLRLLDKLCQERAAPGDLIDHIQDLRMNVLLGKETVSEFIDQLLACPKHNGRSQGGGPVIPTAEETAEIIRAENEYLAENRAHVKTPEELQSDAEAHAILVKLREDAARVIPIMKRTTPDYWDRRSKNGTAKP